MVTINKILTLVKVSDRQSNMELFRIVAMFLVLVVHANFFSLGAPTIDTVQSLKTFTLGQYFFQSLSIGCVDMFVLISGWFGIRPKIKSFANFIFQCLFFLLGIYIFCLLTGLVGYTISDILTGISGCFLLLKWNWFIKAYIFLYLLSPMLNIYIENSSQNNLKRFLILFFIFQTIYAWLYSSAEFFMNGFSPISFIGLYILAHYVRLYPAPYTQKNRNFDLMVFIVSVCILTLSAYVLTLLSLHYTTKLMYVVGRLFNYVNPLVIIMSLYLMLYFSKLNIQSKLINFLGGSSFAVFLLHTNPNLCLPYFKQHISYFNESFNGLTFLVIVFSYLVLIFILAVLIDQIRIKMWNKFSVIIDKSKK